MKNKANVAVFLAILIVLLPVAVASESKGYSLAYDGNGNLVKDDKYFYEYDAYNNLVKIRLGSSFGDVVSEFFYDDSGNRVKKIEYKNGKKETTYYAGDLVRVVNSSGSYDTVYYYAGRELVGEKIANKTKKYYHPDALGSTRLVTDSAGKAVEKTAYMPFGEQLQGGNDRYTFTGQEKDSTDLMYYGARYYSPTLKRFTQPDTVLPDIYDPQQLNRYAYARNNPLKYVDDSGHFLDILFDIGAIIWDVHDIIKAPLNWINWASFGADVVCAAIPGLMGGGVLIKGVAHITEEAKAAKTVEKTATKVAKKTYEIFDKTKDVQRIDKNVNKVAKFEDITAKSQKEATSTILTAHPNAQKIKYSGKELSAEERTAQRKIWTDQRDVYGTKYQYHTQWNGDTLVGHPAGGAHATTSHIHVRFDDPAKGIYKESAVLIENK